FQNYFRLYPKLSGMTGTALTEAGEFGEIYKLEVVAIPTNRPVQRKDADDEVYRTEREKIQAIVTEVKQASAKGQPVLIGTVSIEKSELISRLFTEAGVPHQVLNARYHEQEAQIVAQAGRPGAVTIATNMAGRGTDIQLGGNLEMRVEVELADVTDEAERTRRTAEIAAQLEEAKAKVMAAGGLYVIGSERHESRRIDNQLRGRSGRQGDPGASKFFVSLEDDLMRIFGSERIDGMLKRLGLEEGEAITHPWINKALEKAQQKVEARNFDIRKNLLRYDDVMNDQRKVVYEQRREMMNAERVDDTVLSMRHEVIGEIVSEYAPEKSYPEQWNVDELAERCRKVLAVELPIKDWAAEEGIDPDILRERITEASDAVMAQKIEAYGAETMHRVEKSLLLQIIDHHWKEHLLQLDYLRQGIVLRAYAQKDPLNEYKREAFSLFEAMLDRMRETVTQVLSHLEIRMAGTPQPQDAERPMQPTAESLPGPAAVTDAPGEDAPPEALPAGWERTPRNSNCPCGSGKKFKHCHGRLV
ncbi:preprotein translocase subunit SecA, partial [Tistrella mobilis]